MAEAKCQKCEGTMAVRTYRHTQAVGEVKVTDSTSQVLVCVECGVARLTLAQVEKYERRAAALVLRSVEKATGGMFRFARKSLGLKQTELAQLLGCSAESISRWEKDKATIERNNQLAMVAVLDTAIQCGVEPAMLFGFMHKTVGEIQNLEVNCGDQAA
jgi:DNA-binding transcriptional regulator YiaG